MTAHVAEFFQFDELNELKVIQDVIDRSLTALLQQSSLRYLTVTTEMSAFEYAHEYRHW